MTLSQCHQNILPKALCGCCIQQHSLWGNSAELHSHPVFFWGNFLELYSNTFFLWQFYGIVFSKYFLWGNSTELYSQNISFKTTLQSRIIQKSLWANSAELYSQNIHCKIILRSCIPIFCLRATLQSCIPTFKTILRNCNPKIFPLRQFCEIVFSKYFL